MVVDVEHQPVDEVLISACVYIDFSRLFYSLLFGGCSTFALYCGRADGISGYGDVYIDAVFDASNGLNPALTAISAPYCSVSPALLKPAKPIDANHALIAASASSLPERAIPSIVGISIFSNLASKTPVSPISLGSLLIR